MGDDGIPVPIPSSPKTTYDPPRDPYFGVDYLGLGYDIVFGNPIGDPILQIDPGFKGPAALLMWSEGNPTRDAQYLAPVGGYAYPETSCYMASSSQEISSMADYSQSLAVDASVEASVSGGVGGIAKATGSFSASTAYKEASQTISEKKSTIYLMTSYCLNYVVSFSDLDTAEETPVRDLSDSCSSLPTVKDKSEINEMNFKQWSDFFSAFGTHYVHKVHMGGKMVNQITIDEDSMTELKQKGLDVKATGNILLSP